MSTESMRRGAEEANAESHRAAVARDLGKAVGGLAAIAFQINALVAKVEALEHEVRELRSLVTPCDPGSLPAAAPGASDA